MSSLVYGSQSIDLAHLPKAHGEAVFSGVYRTDVSDFVVIEDLGFEPAGTGPHLWAMIRKRSLSTEQATSRLAQVSKTSRKDLGYAGKKDTHAVATQWISLPETAVIEEGMIDESLEVLRLTRNQRKLKIGQLAGNRFEIKIRGLAVGDLEERIQLIATEGVPNYFGLQRFGRSGSNLEAARRLARRDPTGRRRLHPKDGMAASAARSAGFNAIVAARLCQDRWLEVTIDDAVALAGRGSHFMVPENELESVRERIVTGDLDPTAPMAGRQKKTSTEQAAFEGSILKTDPELFAWMTGVFRDEERRAVRFRPKQLEAEVSGHTLELSFWLPKGSFATALFNELGNLQEAHARATS
ncbi:MAG: tRNA pseudouridine(13) synthase TruD [Pseudomonadota bacterium]|nr:tRNA pseudouridine(13) synthase TruD [Pseudomonadota bacterium]MEE2820539.1 tRNA pseudouridine(13) synthase TruD [Pseudomonadota bacterium]